MDPLPAQGAMRIGAGRVSNEIASEALREQRAEQALRAIHGGARVLVAEDNPVNQDVARMLIESAGLVMTLAEDGEAAVRLAIETVPALILMDEQMPRLDGLQATRALREHPAIAHLPIIAMSTACHAGDVDRCLAAGMNDHIAKPVAPARLYELLLHWLGRRKVQRHLEPSRPVAADAVLDSTLGLAFFAGHRGAYANGLRQFLALYGGELQRLEDYRVDRSATAREALRRELHSLAGAAQALGAHPFANCALALESALRVPTDVPQVERALAAWPAQLAQLIEAMQIEVGA